MGKRGEGRVGILLIYTSFFRERERERGSIKGRGR